jgi:hypothetical protein|tara:strand:- start:265 stop:471 length:207 start_codon:yes stop_codon:yes gene_type:complete
MNTIYPKPRWDLENDVLRLEQMIIVYEQEIEQLKIEKDELKREILFLKRRLEIDDDDVDTLTESVSPH